MNYGCVAMLIVIVLIMFVLIYSACVVSGNISAQEREDIQRRLKEIEKDD